MDSFSKQLFLLCASAALILWTFIVMNKIKESEYEKHMQKVELRSELWYNEKYSKYIKICSTSRSEKAITCSISEKKFFNKIKKNYRIIGEMEDYNKPIEYIATYRCTYTKCVSLNIE